MAAALATSPGDVTAAVIEGWSRTEKFFPKLAELDARIAAEAPFRIHAFRFLTRLLHKRTPPAPSATTKD